MIIVRLASRLSMCCKNFNIEIFLDTVVINMINIKLCMMVVLIGFYPFIPQ